MSQPWILAGERIGLLMRIGDNGKRFVVHAREKLTAFVELEAVIRSCRTPKGLRERPSFRLLNA